MSEKYQTMISRGCFTELTVMQSLLFFVNKKDPAA